MISGMAGIMEILTDKIFMAAALAVFLVVFLVFFIFRKRLSSGQRAVLVVLALVCLAYFLFILWLMMGFGSSGSPPHSTPSPTPM